MTTNPQCLLDVREFLQPHLKLSAVELGIKGDTSHVKEGNSYHLGLPQQERTGYAATESPRDKAGLDEHAAALDIGYWSETVNGKRHDLRSMSIWLVAQCKANTADTRDIREVIYSPDGKTVKRWDRLGRRSTGDSTHLSHTHTSFFRDAIKAGRDLTPVYRRYLIEIGLLEDDMAELTGPQAGSLDVVYEFARSLIDYSVEWGDTKRPGGKIHNGFMEHFKALVDDVAAIKATPPGSVVISDEQLERVLRKVVGSVDGASPKS